MPRPRRRSSWLLAGGSSAPLVVGLLATGCSPSHPPYAELDLRSDAAAEAEVGPVVDAAPPTDTAVEAPFFDAAPSGPYPSGPYGLQRGDVFPNATFSGYRDGAGALIDLSMIDYHDPDGAKGLTAIYFIVAAQWCGPCNIEARHAPRIYAEAYRGRGARYVSAVIQAGANVPSTKSTLDLWVLLHGLNFDVGFLPTRFGEPSDVLPTGTVSLPRNYVIDPRTMRIESVVEGVDPIAWACSQYAPDPELSAEGCCVAGKTKFSDGSAACAVDYVCAGGRVCLPKGEASPSAAMEAVMLRNGATPFGT